MQLRSNSWPHGLGRVKSVERVSLHIGQRETDDDSEDGACWSESLPEPGVLLGVGYRTLLGGVLQRLDICSCSEPGRFNAVNGALGIITV
jgi:hypothetical protein